MKTKAFIRSLAFIAALVPLSAAHAQVLLSDVIVANNAGAGSYTDQAALDRGNSGTFIADTSGNFYNGSGLLSPGVNGSGSTFGAITLQLELVMN